jgi:hypothetical protein
MNIIIVGAKDYNCNLNNPLQAAHQDLINLKQKYDNIHITCYDILYETCNIIDEISYKNMLFEIGDIDILEKIIGTYSIE